jgi:hypothetical protein
LAQELILLRLLEARMVTHEDLRTRLSLNDVMKITGFLDMKADYQAQANTNKEQEE